MAKQQFITIGYNAQLIAAAKQRWTTAGWALGIFLLNAFICRPLFRTEYLPHMFSIEALYIALTRWIMENGADLSWYPLWQNGEPFPNTYQPGLPLICAAVAKILHVDQALAYHISIALFYCLGPVGLFFLAYRLSGRRDVGIAAALFFSLLSPSALLVPVIRHDMGSIWYARRYQALVFYGEGANVSGLNIVPWALWGVQAVYRKLTAVRFLVAALLLGATASFSLPAGVVLGTGALAFLLSRDAREVRTRLVRLTCLALAGYLLIALLDPPSALRDNQRNSQLIGGPYHYTRAHILYFSLLVLAVAGSRMAFRRWRAPRFLEFSFFWFLIPGTVALAAHWYRIALLPQPERFHVGMEIGIALLLGYGFCGLLRAGWTGSHPVARYALLALLALGVAEQTRAYAHFAGTITRSIDVTRTAEFKTAQWLDRHLHGERVFAAGSTQFWMNVWTDQPQVTGCCLPGMPNPMGWIVSWQVASGAGTANVAADAEYALLWMRAYGAQAVSMAGAHSRDSYRDWAAPLKFEGVLPKLRDQEDDRIYAIPSRTDSLAHVIHRNEIVERSPVNGIDTEPLRPFVRALEDPSHPLASFAWLNWHDARIIGDIAPDDLISVQETFVPGWHATVAGGAAPIRRDGLGLMVIDPGTSGHVVIDLIFDGGSEGKLLRFVSGLCWLGLLGWVGWELWRKWLFLPVISPSPSSREN